MTLQVIPLAVLLRCLNLLHERLNSIKLNINKAIKMFSYTQRPPIEFYFFVNVIMSNNLLLTAGRHESDLNVPINNIKGVFHQSSFKAE